VPSDRRRRVVRAFLIAVAGLVICWLIACFLVVQHPTINKITKVDAIVVIGPPDTERLDQAETLLAQGISNQLVVSIPADNFHGADRLCAAPPAGVTAHCFNPDPGTTLGEGREVGRLADQNHWTSILVITSKYHVSRARMIFDNCFAGRVEVISAHKAISASSWAYQYLYQSAGYVRAFAHSGC
jgi:uncharacterized SAM-binding protein YcdF (DUF218 family)